MIKETKREENTGCGKRFNLASTHIKSRFVFHKSRLCINKKRSMHG